MVVSNTSEKKEQSANYLWLVTNSKKCPNNNCVAPIQKHEGCNHVKCYRVIYSHLHFSFSYFQKSKYCFKMSV